MGGEHLLKAGVQWGRLYYESDYSVQGDHYVESTTTACRRRSASSTRRRSRRTSRTSLGFFVQDAWSMNRLTLNLGVPLRQVRRHAAGPVEPRRHASPRPAPSRSTKCINQNIAVWRAGASYDLTGNGRTALKASYSRYGLQVGIDRVTNVNPLTVGNRDCPWTDPNGDGKFQDVGSQRGAVPGVQRRRLDLYAPTASTGRTRTKSRPASRRSCPAPCASARCSTTAPTASSSAQRNTLQPTSAYTPFTLSPSRTARAARSPTRSRRR